MCDTEESLLGDVSDGKINEIAKNVRVKGPDGEVPLAMMVLDLAVSHNELEKTKKGALATYQAINERLQEEEETNPDSPEVEALEQAKESAFGLYLRVQRGDEELTGDRDGEYSGYFD